MRTSAEARATVLLLTLALSSGALISGCHRRFGILDIPIAFQGSGYADASFGEYAFRGNLSVVANGLRHWGASLIADGPASGVLTTLCVISSSSATAIPNLAAFELAAATDAKESSTLCIAALLNATNVSQPSRGLYFDVFQPGTLEHLGPCKASKLEALPKTLVAATFNARAAPAPELCPWGGSFIPLELVQPLANATAELPLGGRRKAFPVQEGFSLEGWVRQSFDGQVRATACALTAAALPANLSGLPGAESLWEIGFGDAGLKEGGRSSCGWWARVGRDLVFSVWNASAQPRSACPTTLGGGVPTRTLVDYFPIPSESRSQHPTRTHSRSQHPTPSDSRSPHAERTHTSSQAASPSGTPSQAATPPASPSAPPTPSPSQSPPPYVFTVGELSGGAAIGVVVAVSLGGAGLLALAAVALIAWRRHAVAMAAAAAGVGVGPDGRRSAQTGGGGDYYKAFAGEGDAPLLTPAAGGVN